MATATESSTGLSPAAETANINTLTKAMADAKVSDKPEESAAAGSASASTNGDEKVDEGDSLEDGEIREEEEVDDGKPKTVFDSKKKYNLKVRDMIWVDLLGLDIDGSSIPYRQNGLFTSILPRARLYQRHPGRRRPLLKLRTVSARRSRGDGDFKADATRRLDG